MFKTETAGEFKIITHKEFRDEINALGTALTKMGLRDKRIAVISENRYEYITAYLSSVFFNVIAPIDKEMTSADLSSLIEKFDIKVLFYTNKTKDTVLSAIKDNSTLRLINLDESYQYIIQEEYPVEKFFQEIKLVDKDKFSGSSSS